MEEISNGLHNIESNGNHQGKDTGPPIALKSDAASKFFHKVKPQEAGQQTVTEERPTDQEGSSLTKSNKKVTFEVNTANGQPNNTSDQHANGSNLFGLPIRSINPPPTNTGPVSFFINTTQPPQSQQPSQNQVPQPPIEQTQTGGAGFSFFTNKPNQDASINQTTGGAFIKAAKLVEASVGEMTKPDDQKRPGFAFLNTNTQSAQNNPQPATQNAQQAGVAVAAPSTTSGMNFFPSQTSGKNENTKQLVPITSQAKPPAPTKAILKTIPLPGKLAALPLTHSFNTSVLPALATSEEEILKYSTSSKKLVTRATNSLARQEQIVKLALSSYDQTQVPNFKNVLSKLDLSRLELRCLIEIVRGLCKSRLIFFCDVPDLLAKPSTAIIAKCILSFRKSKQRMENKLDILSEHFNFLQSFKNQIAKQVPMKIQRPLGNSLSTRKANYNFFPDSKRKKQASGKLMSITDLKGLPGLTGFSSNLRRGNSKEKSLKELFKKNLEEEENEITFDNFRTNENENSNLGPSKSPQIAPSGHISVFKGGVLERTNSNKVDQFDAAIDGTTVNQSYWKNAHLQTEKFDLPSLHKPSPEVMIFNDFLNILDIQLDTCQSLVAKKQASALSLSNRKKIMNDWIKQQV